MAITSFIMWALISYPAYSNMPPPPVYPTQEQCWARAEIMNKISKGKIIFDCVQVIVNKE